MAERFYVNCPLRPGPVELHGPEAHHLAVVCRLRPSAGVCLFNGDGHEYPARVVEVQRKSVRLDVLAVESPGRELSFPLEVAAPLPKGDRAQFLIEKLTELGATAFVPLRTRRSVVHPRETRLDRLQRYVIEASKQCGRNVLLDVRPLTDWDDYCRRADLPPACLLAHPGADEPAPGDGRLRSGQGYALAVGPEGGFTDEEIDGARAAGWRLVGLGPRILRVETAALVLAAWTIQACRSAPEGTAER
jgi:16S rRNA (uracil1498-N3)-methyltransferase